MDNINTTHNMKTNGQYWDQNQIRMEQLHNLQLHPQIPTHEHDHFNSLHLQPQQTPSSSSSARLLLPSSSLLLSTEEHQQLEDDQEPEEELGPMKEMIYKIAAMRPVDIDPATIPKPKRRNVRISDDPQSVAARHRRERISERIRILQRLVPGGTKMDTASMLDEAIQYVKFLKRQIRLLQSNSSPRIVSADGNWGTAVPNRLGQGHGSNPNSAGVASAFGGSGGFGEALGLNDEVISDYIINS